MQKTRDTSVIYAQSVMCVCSKPLPIKPDVKIETWKDPRCWILLLDYGSQGGWGMLVYLNGCTHEHTERSIDFKSFNDECAIVRKDQDANVFSQKWKTNAC